MCSGSYEKMGISCFYRDGRDWVDHSRKFEGHQDRSWQSSVDGGMIGRDHERWQGMVLAQLLSCAV